MIRLAFRAPADQAEIVLAALIDLAPSGVEEVDGDGWTEFAVYGAPGELPAFPEGDADVGGVVVQASGRRGTPMSAASSSRSQAVRCLTTGPSAGSASTGRS